MSGEPRGYILKGGKEGYDRLLLLARDRWPDTQTLLERVGLSRGMRCIDIGCGGGAVTLEIARIVGREGSVVGIDMDPVKLDLARDAAREAGVKNVEFIRRTADEWNEPGGYDVVYSRFLLQHLSDPASLIQRMWDGVRPGGALIIEDIDTDGWFCEPANEGFEFFRRIYPRVLRHHGGDPTIGRKLFSMFLKMGIPKPELRLVQPVRTGVEEQGLARLTLQFSAEAIVSAGFADSREIEQAMEEMARMVKDPSTLVSGPRLFQVWSRRQGE